MLIRCSSLCVTDIFSKFNLPLFLSIVHIWMRLHCVFCVLLHKIFPQCHISAPLCHLLKVLVSPFSPKSSIYLELIWTATYIHEVLVQIPLFHKDNHQHHSLGCLSASCWSAKPALRDHQVLIPVFFSGVSVWTLVIWFISMPTLHFQ